MSQPSVGARVKIVLVRAKVSIFGVVIFTDDDNSILVELDSEHHAWGSPRPQGPNFLVHRGEAEYEAWYASLNENKGYRWVFVNDLNEVVSELPSAGEVGHPAGAHCQGCNEFNPYQSGSFVCYGCRTGSDGWRYR
jgi:hypothetical protein